ncbi:MAG: fumarate hydratase [Methanomicrobiaceae archaeon]|uniref:Fumarate hydratase class i, aerobic n=1 Tax=hydrocarbon metagenome TaxID=938273 RepID=A0A0W8FIH5_9ZZZZ|nr:fumarate hydratase [Methanomicrobiaceae archaeon]MDD5420086.1 fumarate hydratase [Methanomicrobiaceae archaeon]
MMKNPADPLLLDAVASATCRALKQAEIVLPPDVLAALERAHAEERQPAARSELKNILENVALARKLQVPICQDTGVPVIYLTVPPDLPIAPELYGAVREGVRRATAIVPLRPNVVDPIARTNTGDNTGEGMPAVHITPGDRLTVTALPKGAGSENVSRIGMLLPSRPEDIKRFVVETMLLAGGKPCPPVVLGVGIGGTFDQAAALAKEALLLPIDRMDAYEEDLCSAVNSLGIGPMGLGGDTTALAVRVRKAGCHTASLPVAVNVQCWACRRATVPVEVER